MFLVFKGFRAQASVEAAGARGSEHVEVWLSVLAEDPCTQCILGGKLFSELGSLSKPVNSKYRRFANPSRLEETVQDISDGVEARDRSRKLLPQGWHLQNLHRTPAGQG